MKILNLTQHTATPEQVADGVVEPKNKSAVQKLLTFDTIPTRDEIDARAEALADIAVASGCDYAMIGGAPYLMARLDLWLMDSGIAPLYSFSQRVSVERMDDSGNVVKTNVFKHVGWVK